MLILASKTDVDTRITCFLNGWCAVEANFGELTRDSRPVFLKRSDGRHKSGGLTKYYLMGTGREKAPLIKAYSDAEAVQRANERYFK